MRENGGHVKPEHWQVETGRTADADGQKKSVQHDFVAGLACTRKTEFSVQQVATPKVRKCARNGRFVCFE
jgi:hypothetical protein